MGFKFVGTGCVSKLRRIGDALGEWKTAPRVDVCDEFCAERADVSGSGSSGSCSSSSKSKSQKTRPDARWPRLRKRAQSMRGFKGRGMAASAEPQARYYCH